jgi:spore maturation protein CgeB
MGALVIVAHLAPGTSDAPLLLARAFERLGWPTTVFPMDEDLPTAERVLEPIGLPHDHRLWIPLFNRRLQRHLARARPAALLLFGSNWKVLPDTLQMARRLGTATALWECNHRLDAWFQRQALPEYDCYFDLDSHFLRVARERGARRVEHLPGCADPEEHHPAAVSAADDARYGADVSFVGSPYPERVPFFAGLAGYRLRLWGIGWDAVDARELATVSTAIAREPVYGLKKTMIYRASAINLNIQGARMVNGENFRLFEIAACEAFCLTTPKPDLERWFRPGHDLETFSGADDLRAKVDRFLGDPEARLARARAARQTVLQAHTYDHRAAQVLDALGLRATERAEAVSGSAGFA